MAWMINHILLYYMDMITDPCIKLDVDIDNLC